jgi:hypothetical protein
LARFRVAIQRLKAGVSAARREILLTVEALMADRDGIVTRSGRTVADLRAIYEERSDDGRRTRARQTYALRAATLDPLMEATVGDPRTVGFSEATQAVDAAVQAAASVGPDGVYAVTAFLDRYDRFDRFDAVAFPIQYGSEIGEGDEIEVIRISPLDAHALKPSKGDGGKVTGGRFMHFGAFLNRLWRENDIMWGRLDAAEVLIEALVPQPVVDTSDAAAAKDARDYRDAYVGHLRDVAHCAILREELKREDLALLLQASTSARKDPGIDPKLTALLETAGRNPELLDRFRDAYARPVTLEPKPAYRTVGRGGHILGLMFREIAVKRGTKRGAAFFALVARLGQLFTGMVEAAVPGSFVHLIVDHWFVLLYVFEILAIVGGSLFGSHAIAQFGIVALLASVAVNLGIWFIARRFHSSNPFKVRLFAMGLIIGGLVLIGIVLLAAIGWLNLSGTHVHVPWYGEYPSPTPVVEIGR